VKPSFALFRIVTASIPASLAFYRRLGLDLPAGLDNAPHAETALPGGLRLAWDNAEMVRSFDSGWTAPSGGHRVALAFACADPADVDQLYTELTEAGYPGRVKPWDAPWGQRYAVVQDPDGNAVELLAPLPTS
jgi:catechol 2,3-dioxygenase-like lactoylglutathione lyase family enzyme